MSHDTIVPFESRSQFSDELTSFIKIGAQKLLQQAVEAELSELLNSLDDRRLPDGRKAVVRNGHRPDRTIQTGVGPITVKIPKIRSKDGEPISFKRALVPPYVRKIRSMEAAIPWLNLKGVSTGEMDEALSALVGPDAEGLSASTVSRLKQVWTEEYREWSKRDLSADEWVYIWVDGIYSPRRGNDSPKLCALVIIGVNERGEKHFLAIEDGGRESTQSWKEVLLSMKSRGFEGAKLAIGDGAMGFWTALDEVFPKTAQQRCWMHKTGNVLNKLPKGAQAKAKNALHNIWQAAPFVRHPFADAKQPRIEVPGSFAVCLNWTTQNDLRSAEGKSITISLLWSQKIKTLTTSAIHTFASLDLFTFVSCYSANPKLWLKRRSAGDFKPSSV